MPELNPNAQAIAEGVEAQRKAGLAGAQQGTQVAEAPTSTPVVPTPAPTPQTPAGPDPLASAVNTATATPAVTPTQTPKPVEVPQTPVPTTRGGNSFNIGNVKTFDGKDTFQAPPDFNSGVALAVYNASTYAGKFNEGRPMTIAQIGAKWAPPGSADDPNNLNANWPKNVAAAYKAAGQDPNVPVDFSNPAHAAAFAKAVHQAEHGKSLDIAAYAPGVAMASDPNVRKGFGSSGVGGAKTEVATSAADTPVAPTDSGLGGATTEAKSLWGDSKDWLDRNERYIVPGLSFIGGMLSSPSRTLAGSIGSGLVAGAGQYGTLGQRQQNIDIQAQTARTGQANAVAEQIRQTQARLAVDPTNKSLQQLLQNYYGHWNALLGSKSKIPGDIFKPGEAGTFGDPRFEQLNDAENPAAHWRRYQVTGKQEDRQAAEAALEKLKTSGFGGGKSGGTVDFKDLHQAHLAQDAQRRSSNLSSDIATQLANPASSLSREAAIQAVGQLEILIRDINSKGTPEQKAQLPAIQQRLNDIRARFGQARGGRVGRAFGGPTMIGAPDEEVPPEGVVPEAVPAAPGLGSAVTEAPPSEEPPIQQAQWKPPERPPLSPLPMPQLAPPKPAPTTPPSEATTEESIKKRMDEGYQSLEELAADRAKLIEIQQQRRIKQMEMGAPVVTEARNQANASMTQQRSLNDMYEQINNMPDEGFLQQGAYPELRKHVAQVTNTVTQALFGKTVFDPGNVAALEDAIKNQTVLAGASSNAIGQHSQGIMNQISQASPGPGLSKIGYLRVAAGMMQTAQMVQDRAEFFERWYKENDGDMTGASKAFMTATDNLHKYSNAAILHTIPEADRKAVLDYKAANPQLKDAELRAQLAEVDKKWGKGATDIILKGQ